MHHKTKKQTQLNPIINRHSSIVNQQSNRGSQRQKMETFWTTLASFGTRLGAQIHQITALLTLKTQNTRKDSRFVCKAKARSGSAGMGLVCAERCHSGKRCYRVASAPRFCFHCEAGCNPLPPTGQAPLAGGELYFSRGGRRLVFCRRRVMLF